MGHYYHDKRDFAEDTLTIHSWFLNQHGYFKHSQSGTMTWTRNDFGGETSSNISIATILSKTESSEIRLLYSQTDRDTGQKKDFDYTIPLVTTPCNYGGLRYWFICPWYKNKVYCGRRVGSLYKGSDYFACRHCNNLAYKVQNENRKGQFYFFGKIFDIDNKVDELSKQIKRPYYGGKPTKKQQRLEDLQDSMGKAVTVINRNKWV